MSSVWASFWTRVKIINLLKDDVPFTQCSMPVRINSKPIPEMKKRIRRGGFPACHQPQYYPRPTALSFTIRDGKWRIRRSVAVPVALASRVKLYTCGDPSSPLLYQFCAKIGAKIYFC